MNIKDALEPTGKAQLANWGYGYVCIEKEVFRLKGNDGYDMPYACSSLGRTDWQPYYPAPIIRPEKKEEVWKHVDGSVYFHIKTKGFMHLLDGLGFDLKPYKYENVIHGQNGWERVYPTLSECLVCNDTGYVVGIDVEDEDEDLLDDLLGCTDCDEDEICLCPAGQDLCTEGGE